MFIASIIQKFNLLITCFLFSLLSVLFCRTAFGVLWMQVPAVGTASYGGFSCQITLSRKGRILQEMHFKPTDQARLPTFASDKTNGR